MYVALIQCMRAYTAHVVCSKNEQVQQTDIDAGQKVTTVDISSVDSQEGDAAVSNTTLVPLTNTNVLTIGETHRPVNGALKHIYIRDAGAVELETAGPCFLVLGLIGIRSLLGGNLSCAERKADDASNSIWTSRSVSLRAWPPPLHIASSILYTDLDLSYMSSPSTAMLPHPKRRRGPTLGAILQLA